MEWLLVFGCRGFEGNERIMSTFEERIAKAVTDKLNDGTPAHGINEYQRICKCIEIVKSGAKQCEVD